MPFNINMYRSQQDLDKSVLCWSIDVFTHTANGIAGRKDDVSMFQFNLKDFGCFCVHVKISMFEGLSCKEEVICIRF